MQIYISKNNQQLGPFEEAKILEMLGSGQLSPNDGAIRQGEKEWQKLGNLYPPEQSKAIPVTASPIIASAAASPAKKSRIGLLLGCGGFLLVSFLVTAVIGFLAYRNMYPADSTENLPDSFKTEDSGEFKLRTRYPPKGNVWGTETEFVGIYENQSTKKFVIYAMTIYKDSSAAQDALQTELSRTCKSDEKKMYFSFMDKNNRQLSEGATCAVPLYIRKDDKLVALGGNGASVPEWTAIAESLYFNKGSKMKIAN